MKTLEEVESMIEVCEAGIEAWESKMSVAGWAISCQERERYAGLLAELQFLEHLQSKIIPFTFEN